MGTRNPAKDVLHYRGELPPTHDKYHIMIKGNLFILFERNQAAILPGHDKVIRDKAVDSWSRPFARWGRTITT